MPKLRAKIVHISDLHFGRNINTGLLPQLKRILKESIAPTFLVVSGDVAENPSPRFMKKAARYLQELADDCDIPIERVLIIPGNHDYKIKGNIGLRRLTRIPFEVYFRRGGLQLKWLTRWLLYLKLIFSSFWPWSLSMRDAILVRDAPQFGITFFGFNSTPLFEWFATGKVMEDQIADLPSAIARTGRDEFDSFLKIALVHHHPVPIPYVSTDRIARLEESFMIFYNAGTFLREVSRCGITLILHGHKHYAGFTDVAYSAPDGQWWKVGVLASGSTTHQEPSDPLGNEFNVVNVYDDDTININQWYFSTDVGKVDHGHTYNFFGLTDVREQRNRAASRKHGFTVGQLRKEVKLTQDGYSEITVYMEDCRAANATGVNFYELDLYCSNPAYLRDFELIRTARSPTFLSLNLAQHKQELRSLDTQLSFGEIRKPIDGIFDLAYKYRLINGHSVNLEEFRRKYFGVDVEWEYASICCDQAADNLQLKVEFFPHMDFDRNLVYSAEVLYLPSPAPVDSIERMGIQHDEETARMRTRVRIVDNCLQLDVAAPVPGLIYRIRWNYSGAGTAVQHNRSEEGRLSFIRSNLINAAKIAVEGGTPPSYFSDIQRSLTELLSSVEEEFSKIDPKEKLEISLAVFDDEKSVLRFVADSEGRLVDLFPETFRPGEGCAGFTFEKGRVLFYDAGNATLRYYISKSEAESSRGTSSGLADHNVLITIPWTESDIAMGVLSIGSASSASRLLHIFDLDIQKQTEIRDFFIGLTKIFGANIFSLLLE